LRVAALERFLKAKRGLVEPARLLLDIAKLLCMVIRLDAQECCPPFALKDRLLKSWPELQMRIIQLAREGSPPP